MTLWPTRLAVLFNAVAAAACLALLRVAPSRPAVWAALAGCGFFAAAAAAFAAMLLLRRRHDAARRRRS